MAYLLILLAAIANACMDRVETPIHFDDSIFHNKNKLFYSKVASSQKAFIPGTKYRFDFWHLCKSIMIILLVTAIVTYVPIFSPLIDFCVMGIIWNQTFSFFYHKLLIKNLWTKKN